MGASQVSGVRFDRPVGRTVGRTVLAVLAAVALCAGLLVGPAAPVQAQEAPPATSCNGEYACCDWSIVPAPLWALPPEGISPFQVDSWLGLLLCDGVGVEVIWVGPPAL
jgi:hypothetical protein